MWNCVRFFLLNYLNFFVKLNSGLRLLGCCLICLLFLGKYKCDFFLKSIMKRRNISNYRGREIISLFTGLTKFYVLQTIDSADLILKKNSINP